MLPEALSNILSQAPKLAHLTSAAEEETWGRQTGFPVVFVDATSLDEDALMELSDTYGDALLDSEVELFDEKSWKSDRYTLVAVLGVFDDPNSEELGEAFPYVAQMDGLVLWDGELGKALLLDGDSPIGEDLGASLPCVAASAEELVAQVE